jgi:serine protease inhibitor
MRGAAAVLIAAALLPSACSSGPQPTPTATPAVAVEGSSFADGRGLQIGFKLLYALDSLGVNGVLGTTGLAEALAAAKAGAAGKTEAAFAEALGMQEMLPRQINDVATRMRDTLGKLKQGRIDAAWGLFVPEGLYINESFNDSMRQGFQLRPDFKIKYPFEAESTNAYLSEWADDTTGGRIKKVSFTMPQQNAPFFVDILLADPDWQTALEAGKSRPLPFTFADGAQKAVPTMVCLQNCGVYQGPEVSVAILPTSGDETRLVVFVPPEDTALHDFIPKAAVRHDEWIGKATWGTQRVLLPRFSLKFNGSALGILDEAGLAGLFGKGQDYSDLGKGLFFSDILHMASLVVDESGADPPDPSAPTYRANMKDETPTLAVNRPFIVALEKTDENGECGQVLMMGVVYDPLSSVTNTTGPTLAPEAT